MHPRENLAYAYGSSVSARDDDDDDDDDVDDDDDDVRCY